MFHTFSYDNHAHAMLLSAKVWSDFGSHIAFIRSFSEGRNWPPQHPLFPNEPIRYHFLVYFLIGMLEKASIRIDWALNIPSALGFFLLLTCIFLVTQKIFKDQRIALLSVIFFLFNGSLSFLQFFEKFPLSSHTLIDILHTKEFTAFAPWGKGDITAFWNLNIYTNQRHLALAFGIALIFLYTILTLQGKSWKNQWCWAVMFGVLFGMFPFFHQPTLLIIAVLTAIYFVLFPKLRLFLATSGIITSLLVIPQVWFFFHGPKLIAWYPGYLTHNEFTLGHFVSFWWQNLGLHSILIPLGFFLVPTRTKKLFLPIFVLFIIANLFKFSPEVAANHKLFNFALILGQMLSAYALIRFWSSIVFIKCVKVIIVIILLVLLTLSGIIDFMVVFNDIKGPLLDIPANKTATWIAQNTPKDSVILNSSFLYHPASIAGRKIFLGWPYFAWSEGYDTNKRLADMKLMYESSDVATICTMLKANHISYVTFQSKNASQEVSFNEKPFKTNFTQVFSDASEGFTIYSTRSGCP